MLKEIGKGDHGSVWLAEEVAMNLQGRGRKNIK
jgi:hypothetical protein